jgi:hypothetical protein
MAERKGNQTPNTPQIRESEIARMKVDELRSQLRDYGVSGTSGLRKDELVKKLVKTLRSEQRKANSAAKKSTSGAETSTKETASAKKSASGSGVKESASGSAGKRSTSGSAAKKSGSAGTTTSGGIRRGKQSSKSLDYSQEITSTSESPERPGRSLVTTDHDVIRSWADERGGRPATVAGTGRGATLGVLRIDFPSGGRSANLREVSWDDWFQTFDERRLNFIYQEERSEGQQSNFFRLESPDREDA